MWIYRALLAQCHFGKYHRLYLYTEFDISAALFLLYPKVAKELLQGYILPLRFYGRERDIPYIPILVELMTTIPLR